MEGAHNIIVGVHASRQWRYPLRLFYTTLASIVDVEVAGLGG